MCCLRLCRVQQAMPYPIELAAPASEGSAPIAAGESSSAGSEGVAARPAGRAALGDITAAGQVNSPLARRGGGLPSKDAGGGVGKCLSNGGSGVEAPHGPSERLYTRGVALHKCALLALHPQAPLTAHSSLCAQLGARAHMPAMHRCPAHATDPHSPQGDACGQDVGGRFRPPGHS